LASASGGDVPRHQPFEGDRRATDSSPGGERGREAVASLALFSEADAVLGEDVFGVSQHVHQVQRSAPW
jgi:hypothetical protein